VPPLHNETQLSIHAVPLTYLPEEEDQLLPYLHELIRNASGVSILSARYLNSNPELCSQKSGTSMMVPVSPPDTQLLLPSINLFSRNRTVEKMHPSSKFTQYTKCWKFGQSRHVAPATLRSVPFALSLTASRSIAALTLPALRVATSTRSLAAVHAWWHAVLTTTRSTLHAAGIAPQDQSPLKNYPRHPLDRRRML